MGLNIVGAKVYCGWFQRRGETPHEQVRLYVVWVTCVWVEFEWVNVDVKYPTLCTPVAEIATPKENEINQAQEKGGQNKRNSMVDS